MEPEFTALESCLDGGQVARPGDILIVHCDHTKLTSEQVDSMRMLAMERLPGLSDVVFMSCLGTTIYRPDPA
jgi:hypothetical protein